MANVQNPIVGRASGRLANTVFSTWKGINVIKSKPLTVANPRTPAQVRQRSRLTFLSRVGKSAAILIRASFAILASRQTSFNAFSRANFPNFANTTNEDLQFNTQFELFSNGLILSPNNADFVCEVDQPSGSLVRCSVPVGRASNEFRVFCYSIPENDSRPSEFDVSIAELEVDLAAVSGYWTKQVIGGVNHYFVVVEKATRKSRQFQIQS